MTWKLSPTWNLDPLPAGDQQSVAYLLVDMSEEKNAASASETEVSGPHPPLNLSMVLDTSGSMAGAKLQNLKTAVHKVIEHLSNNDTVAITLFDEEVIPLIPLTPAAEAKGMLEQVDAIREANGTAMSKGLSVGLGEALKGRLPGAVSRILVLTDGQTWGDAEQCKALARQAGAEGIPLTALGVGAEEDWSIELLDEMAAVSGGISDYIAKPEEISAAFARTIADMQQTIVRNARVTVSPSGGVSVRSIYRVAPIISKLWPSGQVDTANAPETANQGEINLPLGDMQANTGQTLLFEVLLPPRKPGQYRLARLLLSYEENGEQAQDVQLDIVATFAAGVRREASNSRVMNSVEKATAFKLQTRALQASMLGDVANATRNLRAAATRLLNMGETDLANAAESEARMLETRGQMSPAGTKKLAFETRKLAVTETENTRAATVFLGDNQPPAP